MKKQKAGQNKFSQSEIQVIKQLREHPRMMERVQSILEITGSGEGPFKTADQVEELLIQEMRQLGNTSMNQWAMQAEKRVSNELKVQNGTVRSRKKKR
jgi:hypothetical protein